MALIVPDRRKTMGGFACGFFFIVLSAESGRQPWAFFWKERMNEGS